MAEVAATPEPKIDFAPGERLGSDGIFEEMLISSHVRKIRFTVRSLDFACSVFVIASLSRAFHLFSQSDASIWPPSVDDAPQRFLLAIAVLSLLFNSYILITYLARRKGVRTAVSRLELGFQLGTTVIFLFAFAGGGGLLALLANGSAAGGRNIFKVACERAQTSKTHKEFWGICWTMQWAEVCSFIGAALSAVSAALYILIVARWYHRRRVAKRERQAAEARALSLENYNARGVQNPRLVSEMTKSSFLPAIE